MTTEVTTTLRRDSRFVKMIQLSDIHFFAGTKFSGLESKQGLLKRLMTDIAQQHPDLICVTGDISDSPQKDKVKDWVALGAKVLGRPHITFAQLLDATWLGARDYFEEICRAADLEPSERLFVIPGNHDYRVQGFAMRIEDAKSNFAKAYEAYFRNCRFIFCLGNDQPIGISIVSIDSNPPESDDLSLATGLISEIELEKLGFMIPDLHTFAAAGVSPTAAFRICLLHHHPLPVVPAESIYVMSQNAGWSEWIRGIKERLTGAETTLLRNAGQFLSAAISTEVDLVLHGHEHKAWISELRYPTTKDFHRIVVAAAGSINREKSDICSYNVVRLHRDGTMDITQRCLEDGQPGFVDRATFPKHDHAALRSDRRRKTESRLQGRETPRGDLTKANIRYGSFRANEVSRVTELQSDGNVVVTRRFRDLRATDCEHKVLPLYSYSAGSYIGLGSKPKLDIIANNGYDIRLAPTHVQDDADAPNLTLEFDPPLRPDIPVSFDVRYSLCNACEFVTEYRRSRWDDKDQRLYLRDREYVRHRTRSIFHDRYSETVIFPEGCIPSASATVYVYDSQTRTDTIENQFCRERLQYSALDRTLTLSIDSVLPDLIYEVSWPLSSKTEFEQARYNANSLHRVRKVGYTELTSEKNRKLVEALKELRDYVHRELAELEHTLMDADTELELFLVRFAEDGVAATRSIGVSLISGAHIPGSQSTVPIETMRRIELPSGIGLAGQSFRSESVLFDSSEGRSGMYRMVPGQVAPHHFLCTIPLPALNPKEQARSKANGKRDALYGVLCAGSYRPGSGLEQMNSESKLEASASLALIDWVKGQFASKVLSIVIGPANPGG